MVSAVRPTWLVLVMGGSEPHSVRLAYLQLINFPSKCVTSLSSRARTFALLLRTRLQTFTIQILFGSRGARVIRGDVDRGSSKKSSAIESRRCSPLLPSEITLMFLISKLQGNECPPTRAFMEPLFDRKSAPRPCKISIKGAHR